MSDKAKIEYDGKNYETSIVEGSYAERAIDIRSLRKDTGLITLDSGYMNTGATESAITATITMTLAGLVMPIPPLPGSAIPCYKHRWQSYEPELGVSAKIIVG